MKYLAQNKNYPLLVLFSILLVVSCPLKRGIKQVLGIPLNTTQASFGFDKQNTKTCTAFTIASNKEHVKTTQVSEPLAFSSSFDNNLPSNRGLFAFDSEINTSTKTNYSSVPIFIACRKILI